MPLNQPGLKDALQALAEGPGATIADCAQQWADAVQAYVTPIAPPSTTLSAACEALKGLLVTAFAAPAAAPGMEAAFTAFGAALGGGMVGFGPLPPLGQVGFDALFTKPYPSTHAEAAQNVSLKIHAWMLTGKSNTLPSGPVIDWT